MYCLSCHFWSRRWLRSFRAVRRPRHLPESHTPLSSPAKAPRPTWHPRHQPPLLQAGELPPHILAQGPKRQLPLSQRRGGHPRSPGGILAKAQAPQQRRPPSSPPAAGAAAWAARGPFGLGPCGGGRGGSPGLPHPSSPRRPPLRSAPRRPLPPEPRLLVAIPSTPQGTPHPSCWRHGPERKREAAREGAASPREQVPPRQGPLRLPAPRLTRVWSLAVERHQCAPLSRTYVLFNLFETQGYIT